MGPSRARSTASRVAPRLAWARVRDSLWFLPSVITSVAALLAFAMVWLDRLELLEGRANWFVFGAGVEGARGVLSTIAGSIITVTGVVFSITIVVLQLASTQFSPRVLRSFIEDRANQLVLGIFIGTFTYCLLVLRTVRSRDDDLSAFVPALAVTGAIVLALASIGCLIFFINHVARTIQAEVVVERVTRHALEVVDRLFPEELGKPAGGPGDAEPQLDPTAATAVNAAAGGYLQAIEEERLMELADEHDLLLRLEHRIGDFVIETETLSLVWCSNLEPHVADRLRSCIRLGPERTRYQDVERGIMELTDLGVRALSPGINDPTTAVVCVDRVTQVLAILAAREFPATLRAGKSGRLRIIARRTTFDDLVSLGYGALRHHGAREPAVALRLAESLNLLFHRAPQHRRAPLLRELRLVVESARREIRTQADAQLVAEAASVGIPATDLEPSRYSG